MQDTQYKKFILTRMFIDRNPNCSGEGRQKRHLQTLTVAAVRPGVCPRTLIRRGGPRDPHPETRELRLGRRRCGYYRTAAPPNGALAATCPTTCSHPPSSQNSPPFCRDSQVPSVGKYLVFPNNWNCKALQGWVHIGFLYPTKPHRFFPKEYLNINT